MRAEEIPELKWWLNKPADYKWLHHDYVNEMLKMMAHEVINIHIRKIKSAEYYSIIVDETMDVSRLEQISISSRITLPDFTVKEIFMGFYETSNTKSETLLNIIKDILLRYELDITKLRGQCFNGAANMSGKYSGVQTLLRKLESRVLFVHCTAHILNLVAQDAMKNVEMINNFIGVAKDVISFIRDFPKRIAIFKDLQATCDENLPALSSFCPTR
ncbi:PREDICTED: zinc finger MYM-type protein 1-like [Trachymyrmex cornetzi]|uniref:zinc finger MYM-type protein 1-like n=1 Tax=Trachymyrmex cornetzi TaxID=471704 RepID=UPI00084F2E71|nr:PREDICTED: zinc finger MYM-type protein 1-like [Trachymyrmex cornetzi]